MLFKDKDCFSDFGVFYLSKNLRFFIIKNSTKCFLIKSIKVNYK